MTARLAGFLYLFTNATAIFAFIVRGKVIASGDAAQTAKNVLASERLFRAGIVAELITIAGVIALVVALYVLLKPVHRNAALLAAYWRLAENFTLAIVVLFEFGVLVLLSDARFLRVIDTAQLQALAYAALRIYGAGFQIGFFFLGIGSTVFAWLWWKSRLIPRVLSGVGIFGSLVMAIVELTKIVFPGIAGGVTIVYMMPMAIFEFGAGFWLLVKGIPAPRET